ncbi:hypothetical protein [Pseudonocardia alni]|uniref:hypothetical protein n=1 Tax=Pseudonocardia alni TaxID=33907 RepID=UPI00280B334E|nr:hypothetical protein [Pseudonocardia alni]
MEPWSRPSLTGAAGFAVSPPVLLTGVSDAVRGAVELPPDAALPDVVLPEAGLPDAVPPDAVPPDAVPPEAGLPVAVPAGAAPTGAP